MSRLTVAETAKLLLERDGFLILTHVRPDGDTVGCAAGLCTALRERGKTAWVLPNPELTEIEIGAETLDLAETVHEEVEQGAFFRSGFAIESG